ncbi:MAG: DUF1311 domain-containing protein [Burkholderiales bacterium]|jgi:uncharacterized protein YecT (DUF1311 family)|nr:DUF1311 domain-containing protein [Burkholderiales bacterium]
MKGDRIGAVVVAAALLAPVAATASALEHCARLATTRPEVAACLDAGRKAMTDAMLEQFLAVEQSLLELERVTGRGGKVAALKQSQRDFERYLQSHCQVVLRSYDSGTGAAQAQLACEVDLLRSRAEQLRLLVSERTKPKE